MQDSQNGLKLASAAPEQGASSSFFGASTLSETPSTAAAQEEGPVATEKKAGGLALAPLPEQPKVMSGLAVKAAPQTPAPAAPPVPPSALAEAPVAAKPSPPPPRMTAPPPPIPVKAAVPPSVPAQTSGGHGKLWISLVVALLLLVGAGFWVIRSGLPMLMQRMAGDLEVEWVAMPSVSQPWPYIEVNGVHGTGETGRAILSGELVPVGQRSREGVEVAEVESGRVLLRFGGEERYILVGDRTY